MTTVSSVRENVQSIAAAWRGQRSAGQPRTNLEQADFDALRDAGFLLAVVPVDMGGLWTDTAFVGANGVRAAAHGWRRQIPRSGSYQPCTRQSSAIWLLQPRSITARLGGAAPSGVRQRRPQANNGARSHPSPAAAATSARTTSDGHARTDDQPFMVGRSYGVTGDKHFGSGSGIADRMITTAIPDGEDEPAIFALDSIETAAGTASNGWTLLAEWDGAGHGCHPEPRDAPRACTRRAAGLRAAH